MKKSIHPQVFEDATTTCVSCSMIYKIPSTVKTQQVEVCGNCHPVYTGEYRGIMASGRVDRFRKMTESAEKKKAERTEIEEKRKTKPSKIKKAKTK